MASPMLASDVANTDFVGARNPDDTLWVKFENRKYLNAFKSEQEGHPVFEMREFVTIQAPGDQLSAVDTFATDKHQKRFPRQWAQYQNTQTTGVVNGWAIETWPLVTSAQAEELKYRKFMTVEMLAEAPFNLVQSMGMGFIELQNKAKVAIANAKDGSFALKQAAEIQKRDDQLAAMQEQINSLLALQSVTTEPKRGRPAKEKDE